MGVAVERVLVQGSVEFRVSCNDLMGLVTPEQAADERFMKNWFADKAFKMIDLADTSVDYDNEVPVKTSQETAEKLTGQIISREDWRNIIAENKE